MEYGPDLVVDDTGTNVWKQDHGDWANALVLKTRAGLI